MIDAASFSIVIADAFAKSLGLPFTHKSRFSGLPAGQMQGQNPWQYQGRFTHIKKRAVKARFFRIYKDCPVTGPSIENYCLSRSSMRLTAGDAVK